VGRSQLRAVESHLVQALLHDLKAEAMPQSRDVPYWRAEARDSGMMRELPSLPPWRRASTCPLCTAGRCGLCPMRSTTRLRYRCRRPAR